jgi:hypothetical protein
MHEAPYYREKAAEARWLAQATNRPDVREQLLAFARDYEEIAIDLERAAVDLAHSARMPQLGD